MNQLPLITVIITNYNYGRYLAKAVKSVLTQTYQNIELLIINDGSTDNSDEVINSLIKANPKRNIVYINRANKGVVYTRNEGIEKANGEFISFLDADDYFNRDYIAKGYTIAKKHKADVVYPNWHFVGEWLGRPDTNFPEFTTRLLQLQKLHVTPASLIRKQAIGSHKFEVEKVAEDWDFFIGLSLKGLKFKLAKDNYINYRIRKGTRSSRFDPREDTEHFVEILSKHKLLHGDKVINPAKLVSDRHPNLLTRIIRKCSPRAALRLVRKYGIRTTMIKVIRRSLSRITWLRRFVSNRINASFEKSVNVLEIDTSSKARLAVVVHLFYPELWPLIRSKLSKITEPFDLYVSVRDKDKNIELEKVGANQGSTNIVAFPNRGRDVLPFLLIARKLLENKQYRYVLKLHSKKSPHRKDGKEWFDELLDELIPYANDKILTTLGKKSTGVVGPASHVVSLERYMGGNRNHMVYVLEKLSDTETINDILLNRDKYPFFGGTMFWCRLDYLRPLLETDIRPSNFAPERKQLDETLAHALERILGRTLHIVTRKKMYTVTKRGVIRELPDKSYRGKYKYVH